MKISKEEVLFDLELFGKHLDKLKNKASLKYLVNAESLEDQQLVLNNIKKDTGVLTSNLKNLNYRFRYYSFKDLDIINELTIIESSLQSIRNCNIFNQSCLFSFLLIMYRVNSIQLSLNKLNDYMKDYKETK